MPLRYRVDFTLVMKHLGISYLQFKWGYALFAIQICICPYAKEPDIMGIVVPLPTEHGAIIHLDEVKLSPREEMPSCYRNYSSLVTQEETTMEALVVGLASDVLFRVRCSPVRLGPRYPHHQFPLLNFLALCPGDEVQDPDDIVLLLWAAAGPDPAISVAGG